MTTKTHPIHLPADLHPATADLVARFAVALAEKLHAAEQKYGYSAGWADAGWMDECRADLIEHVHKGDPRDVAAYCAFLWHHGERTALEDQFIYDATGKWPTKPSVYEQRLRAVLNVVNRYLPPGGIDATTAMGQIIALVDPWPSGVARLDGGQQ